MTNPTVAELAAGLSEAEKDIMLGHLVDIPPEEGERLLELGLKGECYFHHEPGTRRMIWPITPLGLATRAHLSSQETTHAE